jgi:transcriptional regulator GlxA family with amidase domain
MSKTQVSIVAFDQFTDIDVFLVWDLLNRVKDPNWIVKIVGEKSHHVSMNGLIIPTHGTLSEVGQSSAVVFASGPGARVKIEDKNFLTSLDLNPSIQLIGSMCSGALILGALGLLDGKFATTYPTAVERLKTFGAIPVEKPFVQNGNIATAAGCLSAQYLAGWIIETFYGSEVRELVLKSIQPVGEGLSYLDIETEKIAASARLLSYQVTI